jgi:isoaspartyl peptidase/L-asparaginase-like protein (Ntn-hydrolase superfamily)
MDGTTLNAGSVGFVTNCCHVSSLARAVMEQTPHVMVVGEGADVLAREMGLNDAEHGEPGAEPLLQPGQFILRPLIGLVLIDP